MAGAGAGAKTRDKGGIGAKNKKFRLRLTGINSYSVLLRVEYIQNDQSWIGRGRGRPFVSKGGCGSVYSVHPPTCTPPHQAVNGFFLGRQNLSLSKQKLVAA